MLLCHKNVDVLVHDFEHLTHLALSLAARLYLSSNHTDSTPKALEGCRERTHAPARRKIPRRTVGAIGLFGAIITILLAIGQFTPK